MTDNTDKAARIIETYMPSHDGLAQDIAQALRDEGLLGGGEGADKPHIDNDTPRELAVGDRVTHVGQTTAIGTITRFKDDMAYVLWDGRHAAMPHWKSTITPATP
ncbi:MAG TPA: hypothetical protein VHX38_01975 [Pseudonocardiaceae bacterium]|jgi:hypothetical protein|nr:hypothetical protein [Pseudonocardiaceae bacterium]